MSRMKGRKNNVRHKLAYEFFSTGRKCTRCDLKGKMGRRNKHTLAEDTRHNVCFDCVPNWNNQWAYTEWNEDTRIARVYPINGVYPFNWRDNE